MAMDEITIDHNITEADEQDYNRIIQHYTKACHLSGFNANEVECFILARWLKDKLYLMGSNWEFSDKMKRAIDSEINDCLEMLHAGEDE